MAFYYYYYYYYNTLDLHISAGEKRMQGTVLVYPGSPCMLGRMPFRAVRLLLLLLWYYDNPVFACSSLVGGMLFGVSGPLLLIYCSDGHGSANGLPQPRMELAERSHEQTYLG